MAALESATGKLFTGDIACAIRCGVPETYRVLSRLERHGLIRSHRRPGKKEVSWSLSTWRMAKVRGVNVVIDPTLDPGTAAIIIRMPEDGFDAADLHAELQRRGAKIRQVSLADDLMKETT